MIEMGKMKGVSPVIETVLIAAAIIIFMVYLVGAFNSFSDTVVRERTRMAMTVDSQKVVNAILLARREIGSGTSKVYLTLADVPYEMEVIGGNIVASTRNMKVNTSVYNMSSYVTFSGKIINAKGQKPYIISSGDTISFGVE